MPFEYRVFPAQHLGVIWCFGPVTGEEIIDAHYALFNDSEWKPGGNVAWNGCGITRMLLQPPDLDRFDAMIYELKPRIGSAKVAIAVHRELDAFIATLLSLRSIKILGIEKRVFYTLDAAADWLGVPRHRLHRRK